MFDRRRSVWRRRWARRRSWGFWLRGLRSKLRFRRRLGFGIRGRRWRRNRNWSGRRIRSRLLALRLVHLGLFAHPFFHLLARLEDDDVFLRHVDAVVCTRIARATSLAPTHFE